MDDWDIYFEWTDKNISQDNMTKCIMDRWLEEVYLHFDSGFLFIRWYGILTDALSILLIPLNFLSFFLWNLDSVLQVSGTLPLVFL